MAQIAGPFTRDEMYGALRLLMPDAEARAAAEAAVNPALPSVSSRKGWAASGITFTENLLVLLSVQSDATRATVERYRRQGGHVPSPEEEQAWQHRRAELRAWLEAGAPRPREV